MVPAFPSKLPTISAIFAVLFLASACSPAGKVAAPAARVSSPTSVSDAAPMSGVQKAHRMPIQGIDVSHHQGTIDWQAVKNSGIAFAYLKTTEGGDHTDKEFVRNWNGAAAAGVPRGAYHFMYWCRPVDQQALYFMLNIPDDKTALPPALDVEWNDNSKTCRRNPSPQEARRMMKVVLGAMEARTGKRPIIYTDINFHREVLSNGEFANYEFWLRAVAAEPHQVYANRPFSFWQFTATGRVPGIKGPVDRNAFNGTRAEWAQWVEGHRGAGGKKADLVAREPADHKAPRR